MCLVRCIPATAQHAEFSYNGDTGPGFWSTLEEDWEACAASSTSHQSPIDIEGVVEDPRLDPLHVVVNQMGYTLTNNGHTIMATPKSGGMLLFNGVFYTLQQFHFHTLSEHIVQGNRGVMELHAVFTDVNGNNAVVGMLYRIGRPNAFLQQLINAGLPKLTTSPAVTVNHLVLDEAFTDTARYYTYAGSLTTPPCTENVSWVVLKQWGELSPEQFEAFRTILGNDFRPLQPRNRRVIRATVR
jgi:carbonic anhydrase